MDINVAFFSPLNCLRSAMLNNYEDILLLRNNNRLPRQRQLLDVTYFKMSVEGVCTLKHQFVEGVECP